MTEYKLNNILKKWQKRLGLSDWSITIAFRDCRDMDNSTGKVLLQQNLQNADIRIMQESDRQKTDRADGDIELDVVHELVHIRLWAIDPRDAEGILYTCREQAVEWIAKALIKSDRNEA